MTALAAALVLAAVLAALATAIELTNAGDWTPIPAPPAAPASTTQLTLPLPRRSASSRPCLRCPDRAAPGDDLCRPHGGMTDGLTRVPLMRATQPTP